MENQTNAILMKSRSASACIKEGYGLYTGKFRKTMAASWHFALLYALACSAICTIMTVSLPKVTAQAIGADTLQAAMPKGAVAIACAIGVFVIVGGLLEVATYSCALAKLKDGFATAATPREWWKPALDRLTFRRTLVATLACLLIVAVLMGVFFTPTYLIFGPLSGEPVSNATAAITVGVETVVVALLTVPLGFVFMKYVFRPDTRFWRLLASDYPVALKHFGFVFIVLLVSGIVVFVAEYILALPAFLLSMANTQANLGVLNGDPLGMPAHITYVSAVVFFIAGFIQIYIRMSVLFTSYYMYGSIETQEEERRQYKETTKGQALTDKTL